MNRLIANFLLIVAVIMHVSPLRTCEWAPLLAAHSCHDAGAASAGMNAGVGAGDAVSHDAAPVTDGEKTCVCNTPTGMANDGGGAPVAPDLTPFAAGPAPISWAPPSDGPAGVIASSAAPAGPVPPLNTPLLI